MHDTLTAPPAAAPLETSLLAPCDTFPRRHLGSNESEVAEMLATLDLPSMDALIDAAVPAKIRLAAPMDLPAGRGEHESLAELRAIAGKNKVFKNYLGQGYSDCITPPVIQRNILENPGWYTAYTPYQAEISQGRMEALVNFQQMVCGWQRSLTKIVFAAASLLTAWAMCMPSAAAVASSSSEALAMSSPVRSMIICWKLISASMRPCEISA